MKDVLIIDLENAFFSAAAGRTADLEDWPRLYPQVLINLYRIEQETQTDLFLLCGEAIQEKTCKGPGKWLENQGIHARILKLSELPNVIRTSPQKTYLVSGSPEKVQSYVKQDWPVIQLGGTRQKGSLLTAASWNDIYKFLQLTPRSAVIERKTSETDIRVVINVDGSGLSQISTGIGFLDHMLDLFARHSGCDLEVTARGDLHVDKHHTTEDTAIVMGQALKKAIGDKRGMERYGFLLPMDESLARVAIDFSGRSALVWKAKFKREKIGEMPTELFYHFFKSFSDAAACNLNIRARGKNEHHKVEAIFKAVARAVRMAVRRDSSVQHVPSTKGVL